jgi:outer membrane lipoprotein-sorting protein
MLFGKKPINEKMIYSRTLTALLTAAAALCFVSGCKMNEAVYHSDGSRIIYMRPPLMQVIEELDERHLAVQSVAARLNVTLVDTEKNKEYQLSGIYLGDKNGNMRLRITATTGQLVIDMGTHGEKVDVWLPRKGRYFQGKPQDLLNNQSQLSLLAHAGGARDLFFPRAWTAAATERRVTFNNGREVVSVIEKPSFIRRRSRRLTMAPESPVVEQVEVYDRFGREVGTLRYSDYRFPEPDEKTQTDDGGIAYPGKIILCSHNGTQRLEMQVEEINLNVPIEEGKFSVPQPENTKVLDMGSALKRSGSLWE